MVSCGVRAVAIVAGALLCCYAFVVFVNGEAPTWTSTTSVCTQPESIVYEEGAAYSVVVREPTFSLSLDSGPSHAVVGRSVDGSYGVFVELNPASDPAEVTCRWEPDHVVIVESNGIEHSIPAEVFTGGR